MKFSTSTLTALATFLATVSASDVVDLTGDNFEGFVKNNTVVMAEFFAPWCGHCKSLAPEYEEAATTLKEKGIKIGKVDCTEHEQLCTDQKVMGFPTLKVFHGDTESPLQYPGARKADSIVSYMVRQSMPAVSEITKDNLEEFKKKDDMVVVGFFDDKAQNSTFEKVANSMRDKFSFGASKSKELAEELGIKNLPGVAVFKNFDQPKEIFDSSNKGFNFTEPAIKKFVKTESFPVIGEVGPATFSDYSSSELPLLYLFVDNDEDREELSTIMKELAPKLKGKAHIGALDAKLYGAHAQNVNLKEEWPAVAIQDFTKNLKYVHPQDEKPTKKSLTKFVKDFIAGKLEPSIKSEEIPKEQGPVSTVVAKNYDDIVLDNKKDVLVEFYAPWCGHCKNLAPTYEALGETFSSHDEYKDKVTIAKVDATANDVPDDIGGFPTIKLYPAGDKENPIEYDGDRSMQSLAEFIKEKGKYKANVVSEVEAKEKAKKAEEEKKEKEEKKKEEQKKKEEKKKDSKKADKKKDSKKDGKKEEHEEL